MIRKMKTVFLFVLFIFALSGTPNSAEGFWEFPPALPPDEHGNIIINRLSEKSGVEPVTFSHWIHRLKYTCRVCHFELEFNFQVNSTEITEAANKSGRFCGTAGCHDGKTAFGHGKDNCVKCHNDDRGYGRERFSEIANLPKSRFGNGVDWGLAMEKGLIKPQHYLSIKPRSDAGFAKVLLLDAEWQGIPPAVFSHKLHTDWLDCNNCHPDIFNIKKKTTKHFSMNRILKNEFCGVCHLNVAFPMNDCKRCHPDRQNVKE